MTTSGRADNAGSGRSPITSPILKVAVVGTGRWGEQHARLFAHRPDTTLCAIVGRTPEKAQARAHAYGTTAYCDLDKMLNREQPDLVTVCLPNEGHFEPTRRLIKRGAALLVEKPLVFDLPEADALLAEAAARNLFSPTPTLTGSRSTGHGVGS